MPEKRTIERARRDAREGKAPTTQAGEFVREEIDHIRHGKHGARSTKQAIAIGLSKARRAGVALAPPRKGRSSQQVRERARRDLERAERPRRVSAKRSAAVKGVLRREGREVASTRALAYQARTAHHRPQTQKAKTERRTSQQKRRGTNRNRRRRQ
jgi:hypothetical protein